MSLANLLAANRYTVTLLVADQSGPSFYHISKKVRLKQEPLTFGIGTGKGRLSNFLQFIKDLNRMGRTLRSLKPDLIISTEYTYTAASVMAKFAKKAKLISWEHHHFNGLVKSKFWDKIVHRVYPKLYRVVCPNPDETVLFNNAGAKAITIPHFIEIPAAVLTGVRKKEILTIGWLSYLKGTDLLMVVAKKILDQYPDWSWRVIGKGDMLPDLLSFIAENNLEQRLIITPPDSDDLSQYYSTASLLVHSSRMESFGLAIAEAMSYGLPAVAFDCPTGPRHIIRDGENGRLIEPENTEEMADAIAVLINDSTLIKAMGEKGVQISRQFSPALIYPLWENLI